jgi:metal-sulfur cluster biosynthetic enzyme
VTVLSDVDVRRVADGITDPCSVALGTQMGLDELGLIRDVSLIPAEGGGSDVTIRVGLTSPSCLYWLHFERELRARVGELDGVASVTVDRDQSYDWDEDRIAPEARRRLAERRRRRRELLHQEVAARSADGPDAVRRERVPS